jgi:hypothetical protein
MALPAADAYRDLVFREWWTRWSGRTDPQGKCRVRAFYGTHRITVGGKQQLIRLDKARTPAVVTFAD